jgi:hypothetical protein
MKAPLIILTALASPATPVLGRILRRAVMITVTVAVSIVSGDKCSRTPGADRRCDARGCLRLLRATCSPAHTVTSPHSRTGANAETDPPRHGFHPSACDRRGGCLSARQPLSCRTWIDLRADPRSLSIRVKMVTLGSHLQGGIRRSCSIVWA